MAKTTFKVTGSCKVSTANFGVKKLSQRDCKKVKAIAKSQVKGLPRELFKSGELFELDQELRKLQDNG